MIQSTRRNNHECDKKNINKYPDLWNRIHCYYAECIPNRMGGIILPILSSLNLLILLALTIFIYLKTRAGSDGYRSILYRIAD